MGWHDNQIYSFKIGQDLSFDIDYIFKWVEPDQDLWFSFWVAPCTLIFKTPTIFKFNLDSNDTYNFIEIADLHKQVNKNGKTEWRIETHIGDITIESETFDQFVRRPPTLQPGQLVIPEERGEISFATSHDQDFTETEEVKQIKREQFLLRQKGSNARHLQNELSDLFDKRIKHEIDTKQYIISKRRIEQQISEIKQELKKNDLEHW